MGPAACRCPVEEENMRTFLIASCVGILSVGLVASESSAQAPSQGYVNDHTTDQGASTRGSRAPAGTQPGGSAKPEGYVNDHTTDQGAASRGSRAPAGPQSGPVQPRGYINDHTTDPGAARTGPGR